MSEPNPDLPEDEQDFLIQEHGPNLVRRLGQVLRTARLHDLQNQAFTDILASAVETTNSLTSQLGELMMLTEEQTVHVNGRRVRLNRGGTEHLSVVSKFLRSRGVGGLVMQGETNDTGWRAALQALKDAPEVDPDAAPSDAASLRLNEHLADLGVKTLGFAPPWRLKLAHLGAEAGEAESLEVSTGREIYIYIRALRAVEALHRRVRHDAPHLGLARIVQQLIELEADHPRYWLKLLLLKDTLDYEIRHPVHCAILSIALGAQLGLPRAPLLDLGMACLSADAGLALLPPALVRQEQHSPEEQLIMRHHPADSARLTLANAALDVGGIRRARVAWEHEMRFDLSAHPKPLRPTKQHLFTRIFAVTEAFDRLTSHRPSAAGMHPEQALATMLEMRGAELDPTLVLHFVNLTGRLPLNTPVQLSGGEIARVFRPPADPLQVRRPIVQVLYTHEHKKLDPPVHWDLAAQNADGSYKRSIDKVLPRKLKPT